MEPWDLPKPSSRRDHHHPSFSSSLLDQIYRSFDDSSEAHSMTTTKSHHRLRDDKLLSHRRSVAADFDRSSAPRTATDSVFFKHTSSSSSDSCGFSSSESDSFYARSRSSSAAGVPQPKPIRTAVDRSPAQVHRSGVLKPNAAKQELGSFLRTKSKALKIYSDLKKVKQPISPGARLASFLNSLFTAGNAKKLKKVSTATNAVNATTTTTTNRNAAAEQALSSTCSSASSFSRSCLSKTPSSTSGKSKRSVRFCPVSVILDEDSRPCGQKRVVYESNETHHNRDVDGHGFEELEIHVMEENRRVIEAAKDLLRSYQMKKKSMKETRDVISIIDDRHDDEDDEDDDAASCASSDLFELDNLSAIGIERYREELPVYETTHLSTNRAIANGFIL